MTVPKPVTVYNSANVNEMFKSCVKMSHDRVLITYGKTTYNILKDRMTVVNQKVDYTDKHHRLKWLNTIEQVYKYSHRKTERNMLNKFAKYLCSSSQCLERQSFSHWNRQQPLSQPYVSDGRSHFIKNINCFF